MMLPISRLLACALLLSAHLLPAVDPDPVVVELPPVMAEDAAAVAHLFAAGDPASVAWAAYHAARLRLAIAVPDLLAHLGDGAGREAKGPEQAAARACAAALADLRQPVEAGVPARIWAVGCRAEAYYLAAIDPARHEAWLIERLRDTDESDVAWQAVANLLAQRRTPEATLAVFQGLAPTLRFEVWPANSWRGPFRGSDRASAGHTITRRLPGFPPVVYWELTDQAERGIERVADGPSPIWASRCEHAQATHQGARYIIRSTASALRRAEYRILVLQRLLGANALSPPLAEERAGVGWSGRAALLECAGRHLTEQRGRWEALTEALVEAHLLPAGTPPPEVRLAFVDKREGEGLEPLPDPAAVPSPTPGSR